jgi:methyl-accepting chemotaxis protein
MIEESVKNSKNGVEISNEVGKVLEEIVSSVSKTANLVGEISAASAEQAQGIEQVNTAVSQMDKVTQQNAANAEESASASEELSAQAEQMQGIVSELVTLVGGSGNRPQSAGRSAAAGKKPVKKNLRTSHDLYHQISAAGPKKKAATGVKSPAAKEIPFDDDFSDFNA